MDFLKADQSLSDKNTVGHFWLASEEGKYLESPLSRSAVTVFEIRVLAGKGKDSVTRNSVQTLHLTVRALARIVRHSTVPTAIRPSSNGKHQILSRAFSITVDRQQQLALIGPKGMVGDLEDSLAGRGLGTYCFGWLLSECERLGLGNCDFHPIDLGSVVTGTVIGDNHRRRNRLYARLGFLVAPTQLGGQIRNGLTIKQVLAGPFYSLARNQPTDRLRRVPLETLRHLVPKGSADVVTGVDASAFLTALDLMPPPVHSASENQGWLSRLCRAFRR